MDKKFNGTTVETNGVRTIAGGGTGANTDDQAVTNLGAVKNVSGVAKIERVTAMPATPDANTLYIVIP